jgi:hypothetical protein
MAYNIPTRLLCSILKTYYTTKFFFLGKFFHGFAAGARQAVERLLSIDLLEK